MKLEIVTTEEIIFSEEVDIVVAPGSEGQLGILPCLLYTSPSPRD